MPAIFKMIINIYKFLQIIPGNFNSIKILFDYMCSISSWYCMHLRWRFKYFCFMCIHAIQVTEHWNRLSGRTVKFPSLEIFKLLPAVFMGNLFSQCPCLSRGWMRWNKAPLPIWKILCYSLYLGSVYAIDKAPHRNT